MFRPLDSCCNTPLTRKRHLTRCDCLFVCLFLTLPYASPTSFLHLTALSYVRTLPCCTVPYCKNYPSPPSAAEKGKKKPRLRARACAYTPRLTPHLERISTQTSIHPLIYLSTHTQRTYIRPPPPPSSLPRFLTPRTPSTSLSVNQSVSQSVSLSIGLCTPSTPQCGPSNSPRPSPRPRPLPRPRSSAPAR